MFYYHAKGIKLREYDLFLDAHRVVPFSFISHGHGDHLRNHKKILATAPTIEFFKLRFEKRVKKPEFIPLGFNQPFELKKATITLFPAGHILGSAMILVEQEGLRLLYTGDFKLQRGFTSAEIEIPHADILIMESTFGHPSYHFRQARANLSRLLHDKIEEIQKNGAVPVILAYSLGKAQEAMKMLEQSGQNVLVHQSVWKIVKIYKKFGMEFPNCFLFQDKIDPEHDVIIIPPHEVKNFNPFGYVHYQTIFLSGWAENNHYSWNRVYSDYALPLSDHADFDELIEFARAVDPKQIYTLHGFPEFPEYLQQAGFQAEYLHPELSDCRAIR